MRRDITPGESSLRESSPVGHAGRRGPGRLLGRLRDTMRDEVAEAQGRWSVLSAYERFEQLVALTLAFLISIIIIVALVVLAHEIAALVASGALNPNEHRVFQSVFGQIMTLLIAMEFKHSILKKVAAGRESIIQVKTVLLIALLAMARKFIILDLDTVSPGAIAAMAAVVVSLSVGYWMIRDRDDRAQKPA